MMPHCHSTLFEAARLVLLPALLAAGCTTFRQPAATNGTVVAWCGALCDQVQQRPEPIVAALQTERIRQHLSEFAAAAAVPQRVVNDLPPATECQRVMRKTDGTTVAIILALPPMNRLIKPTWPPYWLRILSELEAELLFETQFAREACMGEERDQGVVAKRLKQAIAGNKLAAWLRGDEFVFIVHDAPTRQPDGVGTYAIDCVSRHRGETLGFLDEYATAPIVITLILRDDNDSVVGQAPYRSYRTDEYFWLRRMSGAGTGR